MNLSEVGQKAVSGLTSLRMGEVVGCCENGHETLGSKRFEDFLD